MMRRIAATAAACALVVLCAGCSSSPSHLYTLSAGATAAATPNAALSDVSILVGPVSIPAIVDTPQIVVSKGPNQVSRDEFNRWASPLQNNISRVVVDDLASMLGTSRVSLAQQPLNADADYRVGIDVQAFESVPGEAATLSAIWNVRRTKDGKTQAGRTAVREPTTGQGYDALVAAHSRALARLSQDIADAIRALARAEQ
ncbi:MAG: membrane integrity-associated transporter subunit PqiC [Steroidobacteraceae bacterium]